MKYNFLITTVFIFIAQLSFSQNNQVYIQEDAANGSDRTLMVVDNVADGSHGSTVVNLRSGNGTNTAAGFISITNDQYTAINDINSMLNFTSGSSTTEGRGINFRCAKTYGQFRYYIGGYNSQDLKMILNEDGYLGIGTDAPKAKVHVQDGDIYIEDVNSGVIMTSPNGQCWRMTIGDDGEVKVDPVGCP